MPLMHSTTHLGSGPMFISLWSALSHMLSVMIPVKVFLPSAADTATAKISPRAIRVFMGASQIKYIIGRRGRGKKWYRDGESEVDKSMRHSSICFLSILLFLLSGLAAAGDVNGKWKAEFTSPDGTPRVNTFTFKADGAKLTGAVAGSQDETPIKDGKISGDEISFSA